jgi:hypothetical protein
MIGLDEANTCTLYVWLLTGQYYADSHFNFGRLQLDLDTFIRLHTRAGRSYVGSGDCLFWTKRTLVHGTFGRRRVTIMWILTSILVACNWILSCSFDDVQERVVPMSDLVIVCFERSGGTYTVRLDADISLAHTKVLSNFGRMRLKLVTFF